MKRAFGILVGWLAAAAVAFSATEKVGVDKAEELISDKVQILDVRTEKEWNEGRLADAVRVEVTADGFAEAAQKAVAAAAAAS